MTYSSAPAGWYPDPDGSGGRRYFDGTSWTGHRSPPPYPPYPPYGWQAKSPWKGAQIGRPQIGPGSLADPGRRLAARVLDGLVLLPVFAGLTALAVVLVAPHAGPMFPKVTYDPNASTPTPGFVWIYVAVAGALVASGLVMVIYETAATARFGRTLGKAWLRIRPLRPDGRTLGWGRSFGRVTVYWLAGILNWLGALDPLWCLWDENRQCLHDKVVDTIVVNDTSPGVEYGTPAVAPIPPTWPGYAHWGYAQFVPKTNGLAIASLACSIVGLPFVGIPAVLGVVFGFVSRSQIRSSGGSQTGDGLALAGIIVGFTVTALWVAFIIASAVTGSNNQ
jgi:uncharacterized RDD family membrane protein YckC